MLAHGNQQCEDPDPDESHRHQLYANVLTCVSLASCIPDRTDDLVQLDKIISAIRNAGGEGNTSQDVGVQLMSMGFIGVGIFTLLIAMRQHKRELIRLRSDPYLYRDEPSLSIATATAVLVIGVLAFLLLLSGFI